MNDVSSRTLSLIGLAAVIVVIAVAIVTGGSSDEDSERIAAEPAAPDQTAADPDTTVATTGTTTAEPDTTDSNTGAEEPAAVIPGAPDLPDRGVHRDLVEIDGWLQSDVTSLEELRGQVVAVQFWTFGCHNCTATLPHLQDLYASYHDAGFEIVGIHAPEFEFEADVDNIVAAAEELGVTWPIVLDTEKRTFHDWQEGRRGYWPRIYLLDRDGHVRYDHIGEGHYDEIDAAVAALLAES